MICQICGALGRYHGSQFLLIINNFPITVPSGGMGIGLWGTRVGKVLKFGWDLPQQKCLRACSEADSVVKVGAGNEDLHQEREILRCAQDDRDRAGACFPGKNT